MNWAIYVGDKSVHQVEIGHAPIIAVEEQNDWNLEQAAVRETEKNVPTDQQQLMTETTNVPNLLKILECLERYSGNIKHTEESYRAGSVSSSWRTEF